MHPGVRYILCVAVGPAFETCSYKLYRVVSPGTTITEGPDTPIGVKVDSNTIVQLDARRLLGLSEGSAIPPGFPDPFEINLSAALLAARGGAFYDVDSEEEFLDDGEMQDADGQARVGDADADRELGED